MSRVVQARLGDLGCIVVALFIGGLATDAAEAASGSYAPVNDLVGLAALVALWWRRRFPLAVAAVTFAAAAIAPLAGGAAIVSVYTVAAHHQRRTSLAVAALYVLYLVSGAASLTVFRDEDPDRIGGVLAAVAPTLAVYGWGLAVRSRRELLAALAERAERAEANRTAALMEARQGERNRIAREMHDVLAHRLSLLSLHAGALELRPDAAPEEVARAAGVVRDSAYQALEDLREVIGVLRTGVDRSDETPERPQPTLADLPDLVDQSRRAGMRVRLDWQTDALSAVPAGVGRSAYRIVQEGLTNARKHAPDAEVAVTVRATPGDGVTVEIRNPSRPMAPAWYRNSRRRHRPHRAHRTGRPRRRTPRTRTHPGR